MTLKMKNKIYGVFGASGFGREVMPLARGVLSQSESYEGCDLYFVDDNPPAKIINGVSVLTYEEFVALDGEKQCVIAIADAVIREKITNRCKDDDVGIWSISASNVVVMDDVTIGEGSILTPFVTLTSNVSVGKSFHANIYSYVAHDCVIGDYVTFAPAVKCNGNVVIEDYAYIGTGAIIKQGRPGKPVVIGKGAVVGMGAVVTKNVAPGAVVVGNPAKPLARKGLGG